MKRALLFISLISLSFEQGFNSVNSNSGNNLNNIPNQNDQFLPQQNVKNPQNIANGPNQFNPNQIQNPQSGNYPAFQNNQQNGFGNQQPPNNQYGNFPNINNDAIVPQNQFNNNNPNNNNQLGNVPQNINYQPGNAQQYQNVQYGNNQPQYPQNPLNQINQQMYPNQQYLPNGQYYPNQQYANRQPVYQNNITINNINRQNSTGIPKPIPTQKQNQNTTQQSKDLPAKQHNNLRKDNPIPTDKTQTKNNEQKNKAEDIYFPKTLPFPKNFTSIFNPKYAKLSRHYEDCNKEDLLCRSGLTCKYKRCLTKFEAKKSKSLGLKDKNKCGVDNDCPAELECIKHRCVNDEDEVDVNRRNVDKDPSVNLLFAGSIFLNNKAYESGSNPDGTFNYDHLFEYIKDDIKKADLAVVDQETIFETEKKGFVKKVSNTPSELGDAIAKAGFKVVLHGTLYAFAKEERGIKNTLNFWKKKYPSIKILGIDELPNNKDDYYIFKKNEIKVGLINFYGYNYNIIPKEKEFYVNIIKKEKLKGLVEKLSTETDFVIVCINWGNKNSTKPSKSQIKLAKEITKHGAKLIIGHHPSVVQPVSHIKSKGKRSLVFWSLGHLVSDSKKQFSLLGAMANITISKSGNGAYISEYNLIPIINHKENGKRYKVYKLSQYPIDLFNKIDKNMINCTRNDVVKKCKSLMSGLADCY